MSKLSRVSHLALLAAGGLLLIGGGGGANAAVMTNEFDVPVNGNPITVTSNAPAGFRVANEIGTATVGVASCTTPLGNQGAAGGLCPQIMFQNTISAADNVILVFTLGGGATWQTGVLSGNLKFSGTCGYTTVGVTGGVAGTSSVTFTLGAQNGGCVQGTGIVFDIGGGPKLKYPSGNSGATTISATMNYATSAGLTDNGVNPGTVTLLTFGDANRATYSGGFLALDVASGNTKFQIPAPSPSGATSPTTGVIGVLNDKVDNCTAGTPIGQCQTPTLFYNETLGTSFNMTGACASAACKGTAVISNLPAAVNAVGSVSLKNQISAVVTACSTPAGGVSTCILDNTEMDDVALTNRSWDVQLVVDGVTAMPATTVTGSFVVNYSPVGYITDTKIPAGTLVGTIGTQGCAIEFNTLMGANSGGAGNVATYRLTNVSNKASRVFMSFVKDNGTSAPAFQATGALYPVGSATLISMATAMPGDLLSPGATVEFFSADFTNLLGGAASGVTGNYGARGRVRFFVETSQKAGTPASEGALSNGGNYPGGSTTAGCTAEAFMCTGNPQVCSIFKPEIAGQDSVIIRAPNK